MMVDEVRGYLQHVLVLPEYRKQGIASKLADRCLSKLETLGIYKTHIDVMVDNNLANQYWTKKGWIKRNDINRYSLICSEDKNV